MAYEDFNIGDNLLALAGFLLDKPVKNLIMTTGITEKQLNTSGPLVTSTSAKAILNDYIKGRNQSFSYELNRLDIIALKQLTLALNDLSLKNEVSTFLKWSNVNTAQNAVNAFSKYEAEHFSQEAIENSSPIENKKIGC